MARRLRFGQAGILFAVFTGVGWLGGCADSPQGPGGNLGVPFQPPGLTISDPIQGLSAASAPWGASADSTSAAPADSVVYVSLGPGTVPGGRRATIQREGDPQPLTTSVIDGGIDPVAVAARSGDFIAVRVTNAAGTLLLDRRLAVVRARPPTVVRTQPSPGKTDVPLNAAIIIVFSEPIDPASVTSTSIRLLRGNAALAGTLRFLDASHLEVEFVPAAVLAAGTDYRLIVSGQIKDLGGASLPASIEIPFATGQSSAGAAAELRLSPDSVYLMTGAVYRMTATVRDAAGNMLTDPPITWTASDTSGLAVSPAGVLTALSNGVFSVIAQSGPLMASAFVNVTALPAATVVLSAKAGTVAALDTLNFTATVRDLAGRTIAHPAITWTSSNPAVATVESRFINQWQSLATVTTTGQGSVTITATAGSASDAATVTVTAPLQVAELRLTPGTAGLVVQGRVTLFAEPLDASGRAIRRPINWSSDNVAVASVDADGVVTGVGPGSVLISARSENVTATAMITVTQITLASMTAGYDHACGLTPGGAAFCWGSDEWGQLGTGTFQDGAAAPMPVFGGLTFSSLSAGGYHTCGLTNSGSAYCWGNNDSGQLGNGSQFHSWVPLAVSGGLSFSSISAGWFHSCGVTTAGAAYCWGRGTLGALGTALGTDRSTPAPVTGGLTFASVSAASGEDLSCGLTTDGAAYCWGSNEYGELGDGSNASSPFPVAVRGGLSFSVLSVGSYHACGLTAVGAAYCWGSNFYGDLGDGSESARAAPVAVTGGLTFSSLSVGGYHTCGLTTSGAALCWGGNLYAALGTGSDDGPEQCRPRPEAPLVPCSKAPVAVAGNLAFASLSAGLAHSCGVTVGGIAYCWGWEGNVPVKVAGQP